MSENILRTLAKEIDLGPLIIQILLLFQLLLILWLLSVVVVVNFTTEAYQLYDLSMTEHLDLLSGRILNMFSYVLWHTIVLLLWSTVNVKNKYKVLYREPRAQRMFGICLCPPLVSSDFCNCNIMPLCSLWHTISFVNKPEVRMLCQRDCTFLHNGFYDLCHKNNKEKNVDFSKLTIPLQFISSLAMCIFRTAGHWISFQRHVFIYNLNSK